MFLLTETIFVSHHKVKQSLKKSMVFLPGQFFKTHRQIIIKRHYDRKHKHMQIVMLLNVHKNLEICVIAVINYRKIDAETQF